MPELVATLESKREKEYQHQKFLAAIQGINLDESSGKSSKGTQKEWDDLKARVFSKGQTADSNDIISLQGASAQKAGFGINNGLEYVNLKTSEPKNPFG